MYLSKQAKIFAASFLYHTKNIFCDFDLPLLITK